MKSSSESFEGYKPLNKVAVGALLATTALLSSCGMEFQQEEIHAPDGPLPTIIGTPLEPSSSSELE